MNINQILTGLYSYLLQNIIVQALNILIAKDIRVENYFAVHMLTYLKGLLTQGLIRNYDSQHHLRTTTKQRLHIDVIIEDTNRKVSFIELKHFFISCTRGRRDLKFYTSNSNAGQDVGIIGDCVKFDEARAKRFIAPQVTTIACAFITHKPTTAALTDMQNRFLNFPQLNTGLQLKYPLPFVQQHQSLSMLYLEK